MVLQTMRASWVRQSGLYALAQPFVTGRRVLELWSMNGDDGAELRHTGAAEVTSLSPETPSLPLEDGAVDVVLCPSSLPVGDDRAAWMTEIARVLSPAGILVLRAPAGELGELGPPAQVEGGEGAEFDQAEAGDGHTGGDPSAWRRFVPEVFAGLQVLEELPLAGVSFRVPGTEDLAVVGDLSPLAAPADMEIVLCAKDPAALPLFAETMLVPLPVFPDQLETMEDFGELPEASMGELEEGDVVDAELEPHGHAAEGSDTALAAELERLSSDLAEAMSAREQAERERDEARLAAAAASDRDGGREATITSLRAAVERQMQRLADIEITLARLTAERDEAHRRAETAEEALHDTEAALRRREWEVAGLSRDIDRIGRSAGGPKG
jgi:SAM-dependent methyltransferase